MVRLKPNILNILILFVIIMLAFQLAACTLIDKVPQQPIKIYSDKAEELDDNISSLIEHNDNNIKIAIASVVSPKESISKYYLLIKYLEKRLNKKIDIYQKQTYIEVNDMLAKGEVDFAFICSLSYVIGNEKSEMVKIAAVEVDDSSYYRSYVIVKDDSNYEKLEDLAGKKFAFTDPLSYTGRLALLEMLDQRGLSADNFFGETFFTYSHDNSIKAVAVGIVDGASVDSILFDQLVKKNSGMVEKLKVIDMGELAGTPPIVASHKTKKELADEFRRIMLEIHQDTEGKKILDEIGIDKYVEVNDKDYNIIRKSLKLLGADYD